MLLATEPLTLWLVLRAFSAGSVAMSGTEAISNGVPAFKPPESKNAAITLTIMATMLGVFFLGVSYLSKQMRLVPGNETLISQIAVSIFGRNIFYYVFQIATMGILMIAGNTAFADFPRLSSILARDNYMPHQFMYRGDRLAFNTGIVALGVISAALIILFQGNVNSLIHLYAIGVFLAFSMSDTGMVVHWWRTRGKGWKTSIVIKWGGRNFNKQYFDNPGGDQVHLRWLDYHRPGPAYRGDFCPYSPALRQSGRTIKDCSCPTPTAKYRAFCDTANR